MGGTATIRVKVRSVTGQTLTIDKVEPGWDVAQLKAAIQDQESIPADLQRLIHAGRELADQESLRDAGIAADDVVVHLVVRQARQVSDETGVSSPPEVVVVNAGAQDFPGFISDEGQAVMQGARTVRIFAIIDCVFLLIFSLTIPILLVAMALPVAGYLGSTYYRANLLIVYQVYLLLNAALRVYLDVLAYKDAMFVTFNTIGAVMEVGTRQRVPSRAIRER